MTRKSLALAAALAACGGNTLGAPSDSGSPEGATASSGSGSSSSGSPAGSSSGAATSSSGSPIVDASVSGSDAASGADSTVAGEDAGATSMGGGPFDAGYYYGDGSFWQEGGAYPDASSGVREGGTDAAVLDASPGCTPLAACCATLTGSSQALCAAVVQAGNATNCGTELSQLRAEGDCSGATVLASQVQMPPRRLVSDGTTLFWTTDGAPGLLAMPVGGGAISILLGGSVRDFLAVDDANVYVMEGPASSPEPGELIRIPKNGAAATLVNEPGAYVVAAATLGTSAYWLESAVFSDNGCWNCPVAVKSAGLASGPVSLIAHWTPGGNIPSNLSVTSSAVFLIAANGQQLQLFSINAGPAGGPTSVTGPATCTSLTADTDAIFCSQTTGENFRIASDGTATPLGPAVSSSYIVFDDQSAYWADMTTVGSIVRAPKAGGGSATTLAWDTSPTAIAIDSSSIYWGDQDGYIKSMPK